MFISQFLVIVHLSWSLVPSRSSLVTILFSYVLPGIPVHFRCTPWQLDSMTSFTMDFPTLFEFFDSSPPTLYPPCHNYITECLWTTPPSPKSSNHTQFQTPLSIPSSLVLTSRKKSSKWHFPSFLHLVMDLHPFLFHKKISILENPVQKKGNPNKVVFSSMILCLLPPLFSFMFTSI